jgi:hypothetical protein
MAASGVNYACVKASRRDLLIGSNGLRCALIAHRFYSVVPLVDNLPQSLIGFSAVLQCPDPLGALLAPRLLKSAEMKVKTLATITPKVGNY